MRFRRTPRDPEPSTADDIATQSRTIKSRPLLAAAGTAIVAIALVTTAMVFSIATGTTDTAEQGTVGIYSEAALSAAAAVKNGVVQAQVLAEAHDLGIVTTEQRDRASDQAATAATELQIRMDRLATAMGDSAPANAIRTQTGDFLAHYQAAMEHLLSDDLAGSSSLIEGDIEATYRILVGQLAATRDGAMGRIALAGENSGRIADAARFLVVLLVPLAVLLAYWRRIRREQHERDLEHRLEKQQAVSQAQDEFIANLSHELRTPLTAIYGFSLELIEPGRTADPEFERELATYIASESADLSRMVEDILTAASADKDGLTISMSTANVVSEVESVLGPLRATGAKIASNLEAAEITTDPLRFRQVVRNLVSNALRHGGPNNLVAGRIEDGFYDIQVRDDGAGIPEALEDRLFTRFIHQGNDPLLTGSVGLGLAIAHLLTTRTGGTISYRRDQNETVFTVRYPLAAPKPIELPDQPAPQSDELDVEPSSDLEAADESRQVAASLTGLVEQDLNSPPIPSSESELVGPIAPDLVAAPDREEPASSQRVGRPYVYERPRWKDREPTDTDNQPPPGQPDQPDLIITFHAPGSEAFADEPEQELLDESL